MELAIFYCESCRVSKQWPGLKTSAYGPCHVCGSHSVLYQAKQADLKPFHPTAAHYAAADRLRSQVRSALEANTSEVVFVVNVNNLRLACWLRDAIADIADHVDVRCEPSGLYIL